MSDSNSHNSNPPKDTNVPMFDTSMDDIEENLWENDCADRKPFAEKFAKIIDKVGAVTPAVFLLDGEWGSGKTYFLKSFRKHLENEGHKAIYFDAFAEDFSADPLLAICGELQKELGVNKDLNDVLKEFLALTVKGTLLYHGINNKILEDVCKLSKSALGKKLNTYSESRAKEKLRNLKNQLSAAVQKRQKETNSTKPLVFIIDELDRCRPTFALELLERVKHLFEIQGIVFVFGANKKSLMTSVCSQYGKQGNEYLQKFFHWEIKLPKAHPFILAKREVSQYQYMVSFGRRASPQNITDTHGIINELYYPLMAIMDCSFRDAEISARILALCLLVSNEKESFHKFEAAVSLLLLKLKRLDLYESIAYKGGECSEIVKKMSPLFDKWKDPNSSDGLRHSHLFPKGHVTASEQCQGFFNRSMFFLVEGSERQSIIKESYYHKDNIFGIQEGEWKWIKDFFVDRREIVGMLENLGQK